MIRGESKVNSIAAASALDAGCNQGMPGGGGGQSPALLPGQNQQIAFQITTFPVCPAPI